MLGVPLVGVVTDYAAHAVWAEPGADVVCAAPGRACDDLLRHGIPADRIAPTGIPVLPRFGSAPAWSPPAPGERLRILLTCGGFGVGPTLQVLRSLRGMSGMEVTVVCGNNPLLESRARKEAGRNSLVTRVIGLERDMPARMAEAHLVIGKPGGLTTSEALASGRPMLLVGAVPGQESCNQKWLVREGAAAVCSPRLAGRTLQSLAADGKLARMAERAKAIGNPSAAEHVLEVTQSLVEGSSLLAA